MLVDEDGDEDDGLPKTCEANDILVPQDTSNDHFLDSPVLPEPEEPRSATFQIKKHSSKSRSFAENHQARTTKRLFNNSFGKGSRDGKTHTGSFLSVNNPHAVETNKLSARSKNSSRLRRQLIKNTGNADCLSQVSESCFNENKNTKNEVDLELIELMKQSQVYGLMDECAVIERISGVECNESNTQRLKHGFTPVSFRPVRQLAGGMSAGKTPISYKSFFGTCSAQSFNQSAPGQIQ